MCMLYINKYMIISVYTPAMYVYTHVCVNVFLFLKYLGGSVYVCNMSRVCRQISKSVNSYIHIRVMYTCIDLYSQYTYWHKYICTYVCIYVCMYVINVFVYAYSNYTHCHTIICKCMCAWLYKCIGILYVWFYN